MRRWARFSDREEMSLSYRRFAQSKEELQGRTARGQSLQTMSDGSGRVPPHRPGAGSGCQDQGRGTNQECSRPTLNAVSERRESLTRDPRLARGCDVAQSHAMHRGRPDEGVSPPTEMPVTSSLRPPHSRPDDSALKPTLPPDPQPDAELAPDVTAGKTELSSSSPQSGRKAVADTLELGTTLVSPGPTISSPPLQEDKMYKGVKNAGTLALEMKTTEEGGGAHIPVRITPRTDRAGHRGYGSSWGDSTWELPVMKIKPIESKTSESPGKRRKPTAAGKGTPARPLAGSNDHPEKEKRRRQRDRKLRSAAILAKRDKLMKVYRTDCEVFALVAKHLTAQDATIEGRVQAALVKSLRLVGDRCLADLQQTIARWDGPKTVTKPD